MFAADTACWNPIYSLTKCSKVSPCQQRQRQTASRFYTPSQRATAEFLGKGIRNLGGKEGTINGGRHFYNGFGRLGNPLPAEQRHNFNWFKSEWDRKCIEKHGSAWPDIFLGKLKGVLNKLYTDPNAFSKFLFDEEREVFAGTRALLVPRSIQTPLAITLGESEILH